MNEAWRDGGGEASTGGTYHQIVWEGHELSADAIEPGLDAALPPILELESQIGEFGRGERSQNLDFVLMA